MNDLKKNLLWATIEAETWFGRYYYINFVPWLESETLAEGKFGKDKENTFDFVLFTACLYLLQTNAKKVKVIDRFLQSRQNDE